MTPTPLTPDAAALTRAYLVDHEAVKDLVGKRVSAKTPPSTADPWVRVNQLDDDPIEGSTALHTVTIFLQLDCYGGSDKASSHEQANLLARTVRAALHDMPDAEHEEAVVTAVTFGAMPRVPDDELKPARERYVLDAFVTCHAHPAP